MNCLFLFEPVETNAKVGYNNIVSFDFKPFYLKFAAQLSANA